MFLLNYSQFVFAMLPLGIGHFIYFDKSLQSLQYWFLHLSKGSLQIGALEKFGGGSPVPTNKITKNHIKSHQSPQKCDFYMKK